MPLFVRRKPKEMSKSSSRLGERWVTIKEGHLKGRRLLIDSKGYVAGGDVPKAFQGHHIGQLHGVNPHADFEHHELQEIHDDFSRSHREAKQELRSMIHETAKNLKEIHEAKHNESSITNLIRQHGGIKTPKRGKDAFAEEYHESVDHGIKRHIGSKSGLPLDEMASELGMSARDLIDRLADTESKGRLNLKDFRSQAEKVIDQMHGHGEVASRRNAIDELAQHLQMIEAAYYDKQNKQQKSNKLAASFINAVGRLLVKKEAKEKKEYYPSDRYAYKTNARDPIYIPVNRIQTPYQTDEALNEDKVKSNMDAINEGAALQPVVIGYDYDLHDGHHRLEAAIRAGHTHVPCVVGGRNKRRVKVAEKRYRKIWKSMTQTLVTGGKLLIKKSDFQSKVKSGDAHWVTIKQGPLEGRKLLIEGSRPAPGEKSSGRIIAGKGIPAHVVQKITGATHAHHLEHEQAKHDHNGDPVISNGKTEEKPASGNKHVFTEMHANRYNALTHYPKTAAKMNADFKAAADDDRKKATDTLKRYGQDTIPPEIEEALEKLKDARFHLETESIRAREVAPPWSVTGRANYKGNPDKADKINQNAMEKYKAAKDRVDKAVMAYSPKAAVSSDDHNAVSKLNEKIAAAEKLQETMKHANSIVKKKGLSNEDKVKKLMEIGLSKENSIKLLTPDRHFGTVGFSSYSLTNNNANIKRMKERVKQLESNRSQSTSEHTFDGGHIVDNVDDNRVQIFFEDKPSEEMRTKLKSRGFKWAQSVGAWQRMRSNASVLETAKALVGAKEVKKSAVVSGGRLLIKK